MLVAAGGGGDALAAAIVHRGLGGAGERAAIATYAWERLAVDPRPGPRGVGDFEDLRRLGPSYAVTSRTRVRPPSRSTLPRLAGEIDHAAFVLLDPRGGTEGLRSQIGELVAHCGTEGVTVVDVGGDVLARGSEAGLRSPLADALVLAACASDDVGGELLVAGPGLDGELCEAEVLDALDADPVQRLDRADIEPFAGVLDWHPSEATALLAAAACGVRGRVEIRDRGLPITLTDHSPAVYRIPLARALRRNRIARELAGTATLSEAEAICRRVCGRCEIDYERTKARRLAASPPSASVDLDWAIRAFERAARARGVEYVTTRRVAEAIPAPIDRVRQYLTGRAPTSAWPLWPVAQTTDDDASD